MLGWSCWNAILVPSVHRKECRADRPEGPVIPGSETRRPQLTVRVTRHE